MKTKFVEDRYPISIGLVALILGALIYLVDRPPYHTYFVFNLLKISFHDTLPSLFGTMGHVLPSFIHVFSFSLMTGGLVCSRRRDYLVICSGWFLIDSVFELGQRFGEFSAGILPSWLEGIPVLERSKNYFLQGTFDPIDLVGAALGAATAYLILTGLKGRSTKCAAKTTPLF